jgi:rhodanese-related sulfurtransferase
MHARQLRQLRVLGLGIVFSFSGLVAAADKPETPTSVSGFEVVTPEQARTLIGRANFFDMRSAINYGKGHIKGAKALPYGEKSSYTPDFDGSKDKFDMRKLPADKGAAIVFYSDGPKGWKSYKASVLAGRAGYKNVKWMRAGTAGWQARGLPLER